MSVTNVGFVLQCDDGSCLYKREGYRTQKEALEHATKLGWYTAFGPGRTWKHYCPECSKRQAAANRAERT